MLICHWGSDLRHRACPSPFVEGRWMTIPCHGVSAFLGGSRLPHGTVPSLCAIDTCSRYAIIQPSKNADANQAAA